LQNCNLHTILRYTKSLLHPQQLAIPSTTENTTFYAIRLLLSLLFDYFWQILLSSSRFTIEYHPITLSFLGYLRPYSVHKNTIHCQFHENTRIYDFDTLLAQRLFLLYNMLHFTSFDETRLTRPRILPFISLL